MKAQHTVALVLACLICISFYVRADDHDKEIDQIVKDYGYPFEEHEVITSDGYILKAFRIPHGKNQDSNEKRPAVIFQHGILDSADFGVCHGPELSPAFYLANLGYDVWLTNSRGNKYDRKHQKLDAEKDEAFWDFSFYETIEDYKSNIEYVRMKTSQEKIAFIAHSQGTTTMWAAMSHQPEWFSERIAVFIAIAPIAQLQHMQSSLLKFLASNSFALDTFKFLKINEVFPADYLSKAIFKTLCGIIPQICQFNFKLIADADPNVDSVEDARVYFAHYPAGTSRKCLEHFLQIYNAKKFQNFDYGPAGNTEKYGRSTPPEFPLEHIKGVPIAMMVGNSDLLGTVEDSSWLFNQIKSQVVLYKIYDYGHVTFFIGKDMRYLNDTRDIIERFHPVKLPSITKETLKSE